MLPDVDFDEYRAFLLKIVSSNTFQQIFLLLVLFVIPFLVLLPWNWVGGSSGNTNSQSVRSNRERQKNKKCHTKAASASDTTRGHYPGLVNISGTYCFMNSIIQAMASLSYLQSHIEAIHARAELSDVPTPVIAALRDLFHRLNTPHSRPSSIKPVDIISVLSSRSQSSGLNSLISSREHQDAQELFQLLTECIKSEIVSIDKESAWDRGLSGLSQSMGGNREIGKSVFDGLTANRRSCAVCGYTETVMHFAFDNWQLAVPPMASACLLDDCLSEYTRLEVLRDCICRRCSVLATHHRLQEEVKALSAVENLSAHKNERLKELKKMEARVRAALEDGRIGDDLKDVNMEKVYNAMSTKQVMIAQPPPVLVLHINRSMHFTHYASKNDIRVVFPEVLDLTPWTTSGKLSTTPATSLSTPYPIPKRSSTPTQGTRREIASRTICRLSAVVCHYGQHSFGHYVCFRRKPPRKTGESESSRWKPPSLVTGTHPTCSSASIMSFSSKNDAGNLGGVVDPNAAQIKKEPEEAESDGFEEYVWEDADPETAPGTRRGWLRISDDSVSECGIETVLNEGSGAFMLYYEKAIISSRSAQTSAITSTEDAEMRTSLLPNNFVSLTMPQASSNILPRPEFTPFRVPYLCVERPFDRKDFWTYPERCGWIVHLKDKQCHALCPPDICCHVDEHKRRLKRQMPSPMFSRSDGRPVNASDKVEFLQAWLFFGGLTEVSYLCGLQLDAIAEFIDADGGPFSTERLNGLPGRWFHAAVRAGRAGDRMLMERILEVARHLYLMLFEEMVDDKTRRFQYTYAQCRVLHSLNILVRLIGLHLLLHVYMPGFTATKEDGWDKNRISKSLDLNYSDTEGMYQLWHLAGDELRLRGWCESELSLLDGNATLFASLLSRPRLRDHSRCGDVICNAYQTDEATYKTRHVETECICDGIEVDTEFLITALSENKVPKLVLKEDLRFEVVSEDKYPYIALSHVWADGLGNPRSNALPRCQLRRLRDYVNQLSRIHYPTTPSLPVAFWMDTLCIPVDRSAVFYRKKAIQLLGKTFYEASAVLILDRELEIVESTTASFMELGIRILCSGWMKRLWTLQEATLASEAQGAVKLYFQTQDGPFLYEKYDRDRKSLYTDSTEIEAEERELLDEAGIMLLLGEQVPSIRAMRDMRKGWSPFEIVYCAIEHRSTSKSEDVPLCITSLVGKDVTPIVSVSGAEQRMARFYMLMREVPTGLLWTKAVERLSIPPFRWVPQSITSLPRTAYAGWEDGICDSAGLHVRMRGFVFERSEHPPENDRKVAPVSNIASAKTGHIHGQLHSSWPDRECMSQIPLLQTWGLLFRPYEKYHGLHEPNIVVVAIESSTDELQVDGEEIVCRMIGHMYFVAGPQDTAHPVLKGFAKTADQRWCIT